ncbi:MAG: hypothetical protein ACREX3_24405 [Gammaproteobacteria bacterium]
MEKGLHVAGPNLADVEPLIIERTGLPSVQRGTLNIYGLAEPYIVQADTEIAAAEYNGTESIKLQRCIIRGIRAVIMRPDSHELTPRGLARLELMSQYHLRTHLDLKDDEDVKVEIEGDQDWWQRGR